MGSDHGSIADSEEENEEEVRACWCVQVIVGRKLRVHLAGSVNDIFVDYQFVYNNLLVAIEAMFTGLFLGMGSSFYSCVQNQRKPL